MKEKITGSIVAKNGSSISGANNYYKSKIKLQKESLLIGFIVGIASSYISSLIYSYINTPAIPK